MALDRYAVEARSIADELLELLSLDEASRIDALLTGSVWLDVTKSDIDQAIRFAGLEPAARRRRWEKFPRTDHRLTMWIRARYLALLSANALRIAAAVEDAPGMKYRVALQYAARSAMSLALMPQAEDVLGQDGEDGE